jgi:hypothetical protein
LNTLLGWMAQYQSGIPFSLGSNELLSVHHTMLLKTPSVYDCLAVMPVQPSPSVHPAVFSRADTKALEMLYKRRLSTCRTSGPPRLLRRGCRAAPLSVARHGGRTRLGPTVYRRRLCWRRQRAQRTYPAARSEAFRRSAAIGEARCVDSLFVHAHHRLHRCDERQGHASTVS